MRKTSLATAAFVAMAYGIAGDHLPSIGRPDPKPGDPKAEKERMDAATSKQARKRAKRLAAKDSGGFENE